LIGPRALIGSIQGLPRIESEEEVRQRLTQALADPSAADALRHFWSPWQADCYRITVRSDRNLIDRVALMAVHGPLAAYIVPNAVVMHLRSATKVNFEQIVASAKQGNAKTPVRQIAGAFRTGPATLPPQNRTLTTTAKPPGATLPSGAERPTAKLPLDVIPMPLEDRLKEMLVRTAPRLPAGIREEFEKILNPAMLATVVGVLAVWAASHAYGVGFVIDALLLVSGLLFAGWAFIEAAQKLYDALEKTYQAKTEDDLDAAATLMAQVIAAIGVGAFLAAITRGAGRLKAAQAKGKVVRPPPEPTRKPYVPLQERPKVAKGKPEIKGELTAATAVRTVSNAEAEAILVKSGISPARAKDFVASFEGPITVRTVKPGEQFIRYGDKDGPGSFLTKNKFATPEEAVEGLYLKPYGNTASRAQVVTATEECVVLEGAVANGAPGVQQTLITNRGAFEFGAGQAY
jgi:hypothetical protein